MKWNNAEMSYPPPNCGDLLLACKNIDNDSMSLSLGTHDDGRFLVYEPPEGGCEVTHFSIIDAIPY
jgi:hypothetical protein